MIIVPCMAVVRMTIDPLAFLRCRDGTYRIFADQVDVACTKRAGGGGGIRNPGWRIGGGKGKRRVYGCRQFLWLSYEPNQTKI